MNELCAEYRIRYCAQTAHGKPVLRSIVCDIYHLNHYWKQITKPCKALGIDSRYRDYNEQLPIDYGWKSIKEV